jgi:hypothetical protein
MTAREFLNLWIDFLNKKIVDHISWLQDYDKNKRWTEFILGEKQSRGSGSPLGEYIAQKTGLRYRTEDGLTDLAFAPKESFAGIHSLHEDPDKRKTNLDEKLFYPQHYEILVEHENNIYTCYEEMAKLTYSKGRLKVLITYNENVDKKSDYKYADEILADNFSTMIKQANLKYPENPETEYLLIIGQLNHNILEWESFVFNHEGKYYKISPGTQ